MKPLKRDGVKAKKKRFEEIWFERSYRREQKENDSRFLSIEKRKKIEM